MEGEEGEEKGGEVRELLVSSDIEKESGEEF